MLYFLTLRITEGDRINNLYWSSFKVRYSCQIFLRFGILSTDFQNVFKYQIP